MWRRFVEPVAADWMLDELNRGSVKELLQTPANESARRHLRASFGAMLTWAHAEEPAWLPEPREHYIPKPPRTGSPPETGSLVLWVPHSTRRSATATAVENALQSWATSSKPPGTSKVYSSETTQRVETTPSLRPGRSGPRPPWGIGSTALNHFLHDGPYDNFVRSIITGVGGPHVVALAHA